MVYSCLMARAWIVDRYEYDWGIEELTDENYSCTRTDDGLHDWECGCGTII